MAVLSNVMNVRCVYNNRIQIDTCSDNGCNACMQYRQITIWFNITQVHREQVGVPPVTTNIKLVQGIYCNKLYRTYHGIMYSIWIQEHKTSGIPDSYWAIPGLVAEYIFTLWKWVTYDQFTQGDSIWENKTCVIIKKTCHVEKIRSEKPQTLHQKKAWKLF